MNLSDILDNIYKAGCFILACIYIYYAVYRPYVDKKNNEKEDHSGEDNPDKKPYPKKQDRNKSKNYQNLAEVQSARFQSGTTGALLFYKEYNTKPVQGNPVLRYQREKNINVFQLIGFEMLYSRKSTRSGEIVPVYFNNSRS